MMIRQKERDVQFAVGVRSISASQERSGQWCPDVSLPVVQMFKAGIPEGAVLLGGAVEAAWGEDVGGHAG